MMNTPKINGLEFLHKLEPVVNGDKTQYPSKAIIFDALFGVCGTKFSQTDFPDVKQADCILKLHSARAKMFINGYEKRREQLGEIDDLLIKPETKDYLQVALGAFIKTGGKKADFVKELNTFKSMHEFRNQPMKRPMPLRPRTAQMAG